MRWFVLGLNWVECVFETEFPVVEHDFHGREFVVYVPGEVFGGVYRAVLSSGAAECDHQVGETSLDISLNVVVNQSVGVFEECGYLTVFLEEVDYGLVDSGEGFVPVVFSGVVHSPAVEHVSASVA